MLTLLIGMIKKNIYKIPIRFFYFSSYEWISVCFCLGVPWSEEEHRTFLAGLEKLGKGDWRGIAKKFVTTRTPTQVASHAQKYFLRRAACDKRKRRPSLFDMPLDPVLLHLSRNRNHLA